MKAGHRDTLAAVRKLEFGPRANAQVWDRNAGSNGVYLPKPAQQAAAARRDGARSLLKLDPWGPLRPLVTPLLGWRCSPQ